MLKGGETVELVRISLREEVTSNRHYWPIREQQDTGGGSGGGNSGGGVGSGGGFGGSWGRNLKTHLTLMTNLTSVKIPLLVFDGKLKPVNNTIRSCSD